MNTNQSGYDWVGFDYGVCTLVHTRDADSKCEATVSCWTRINRLNSGVEYQWAYDPEMDVGKRG